MKESLWRICLLGRLQVQNDRKTLTHLSMRRIGALLACLVLRAPHPVPREELMDLLWPEEPLETARNRLRVLLNALKRHLEPAGVASGSVLEAGRNTVRLLPTGFTSDYHDFLQALQTAKAATNAGDRIAGLESAVALYRGELLSGFYDNWILAERNRLAGLRYQTLRDLVRRCQEIEAPERAVEYARQAVAAEPLDEEAHCDLIRLYAVSGQPSAGLRQYEQLKRLLEEELQAQPSPEARRLAAQMESTLGHGVGAAKRSVRPMALRALERAEFRQEYPANLPPRLTRFFGREKEIAALRAVLSPTDPTRLVSLLGPGGTGKTRLAVETAEQMLEAYAGRVYFIALAEITDPGHIGRAIAKALSLPPNPDLDPLSQVMAALSQAPSLLVLDNMEQLLPEAGPQLECLLSEVVSLHCLVTSRRSAGIEGEREMMLGPLPLPQEETDVEALSVHPGVALFVDRASAVRSDFALTASNAQDVARLCRTLEGMPLAIELAAARARVMTPGEMREQTDGLLDWLVDVRGGKAARHRSLRAALEWSYRLLTPGERRFFCALAVFVGGFTAEAARYVGLGEAAEMRESLALLEQLRAASLLNVTETPAAKTRFGMLETLREFGQERLAEGREETERRRKHLAYFAQAFGAESGLLLRQDPAAIACAGEEEENLREALEFGLRAGASPSEARLALLLASGLAFYWERQGRWGEGRAYLHRALSLPETVETRTARAQALRGAGVLANLQGDHEEARALSLQGLALAQETGSLQDVAGCLSNLANVAFHLGDYPAARERWVEAVQVYRQAEDRRGVAGSLADLGNVAFYLGDHPEAQGRLEEALQIYRDTDDPQGVASVLVRLGNVLRNQGHLVEGRARLLEALELLLTVGNRQSVASCLHGLGLVALFQHDYGEARLRFTEGLETFQEIGHPRGVAVSLLSLGTVAREEEQEDEAFSCFNRSLEICRKIGDRRNQAACLLNLGFMVARRGEMDRALSYYTEALEIEREIDSAGGIANCLFALGRLALERGDPVEANARLSQALTIYYKMNARAGILSTIEAFAALAQQNGQPKRAVRLASAAATLRKATGLPLSPSEHGRHEQMLAAVQATLREKAFAAAWREGETLSFSEAVAEALKK